MPQMLERLKAAEGRGKQNRGTVQGWALVEELLPR